MTEQCALAATTAAHNHQSLATMDVERQLVEHSAIAEFPDEILYFNDCGVSGHARNDE
jgi:hypothetical protein